MDKAIIVTLLTKRPVKLCVVATSSGSGKPEAAMVGYAVLPDATIILSTQSDSRKWHNLLENPHVALVFGGAFADVDPYIQLDGTATLVASGENHEACDKAFFSMNKEAEKFKGPQTVFIKVNPTWARVMDFTVHPPVTEEGTV